MAKAKKNKKALSDAVYAKKAPVNQKESNPFASAKPATSKKMNPFEVHINKEKFNILGRTCKHDKGLPGVSREKAIKRRKETLGVEYQIKHKTNQFKDRRIGKYVNSDELTEDIINARFVADRMERIKQGKLSKFDLNDEEVLTHRGQTLEEIEQFRDDRSDDDEEADATLDANFTEAAHFGGEGDSKEAKDRQSAIEEMIIEQKKRKMEIAKEKDEVYELTEKLDTNYKSLMGLMNKMSKNDEDKAKPEHDDYDKAMREMIFERRGVVTDKLLSQEELAKQEKERLEKLENERLRRMKAEGEEEETVKQTKHRSADDLDDGYFACGDEEEENVLAYNADGEISGISEHKDGEDEGAEYNENNTKNDSDDDSEEEDELDCSEEEVGETEDELDDLKGDDHSDGEEEASKVTSEKIANKKAKNIKALEAKQELPFTFDMPDHYDAFKELVLPYRPEQQAIIVERLIKCNNPKLEGVNRENVVKLFAFLLQYVNELFEEASEENIRSHFEILGKLNPFLFDLMHLNVEKMPPMLLDVIREKYSQYCKNPKMIPPLETVIFFKLVSNLCSTSDFRHPIVTSTYIFMQHILSRAKVHSRRDVSIGLFIVTVVLEFSQLSKRFLPAAMNFLEGIIGLAVPKRPIEIERSVPPCFESKGPLSTLLALNQGDIEQQQKLGKESPAKPLTSADLLASEVDADFKVRAMNTAFLLIKDAMQIVGENTGANYLAEKLLGALERLPVENYPGFVNANFAETKQVTEAVANKRLTKIVPPEKKPKALRLLEPRIEAVYDDKRRPKLSKEKEERVKLVHKLRRETKGAVREIRRDTQFIQKMRLQQQIKSDKERHEKVKRIFHEASIQQGELNEFSRLKKKKKF